MIVPPIAAAVLPTKGIRSYLYQRSPTHKHRGIDLPGPIGTPVLAAAAGTVRHAHTVFAPGFSGYGRVIVLEHPGGFWTLYAHLDAVNVRKGQKVSAGAPIGTVGATAFTSTERDRRYPERQAHLHFEVSSRPYPLVKESPRIDPVAWLRNEGSAIGGGVALVALGLGWLFLRSRGL